MDELELARALRTHSSRISDAASDLKALHDETWRLSGNEGPDLPWADWVALSAMLLEFRPSLIIELGRGIGSSTSLFQYWSQTEIETRIVSICRTSDWRERVAPRLARRVPIDWEACLDDQEGDIVEAPYSEIVSDAPSVLVLWDAHGLEIAGAVTSQLLPALEGRANVVVAHDMRDARYFQTPEAQVEWLRRGAVFSTFEQIDPISDYCADRTPLHSASHAVHQHALDVAQSLDSDGTSYWHWFSARAH